LTLPTHVQRFPAGAPLLQDLLTESARRLPEKVALVCDGQRLTYAELDGRSNSLAHAFVRHGVERGDRVVVFADNTVQAVVSYWAILKANAVACMVNSQTRVDKLALILADCRATALVSDHRHAATFVDAVTRSPHLRTVIVSGGLEPERASRLPGFVAWENAMEPETGVAPPARLCLDHDLASIIYSSGTTGEPKAIMLAHRNQLAASASITAYLENREDDVVLSVLPLALTYGV